VNGELELPLTISEDGSNASSKQGGHRLQQLQFSRKAKLPDSNGRQSRGNDGARSFRSTPLRQERAFTLLLALASITALSIIGLTDRAAAQSPDPLRAYLGFFDKKPKADLLAQHGLQVGHTAGTVSYAINAPRSATGITLVALGDSSSKATAKRYTAPDGKKLKRKAWSTKVRDKRLHIQSFDGLGFGENAIWVTVSVPKKPELAKTYEVAVTRVETLGSDPTLTSLRLTESSLSPACSSDTKSYAADVPYRVTDLGISVQRKEAGTAIQVSGTGSDGTGLEVSDLTVSGLAVGRNVIEVLATAEDASRTENYTVAVVRQAPSKETKLRDLSLEEGAAGFFGLDIATGGGILRPAFGPETTSYEASVPAEVTAVKMAILTQTIAKLRQSGRAADGTALAVRSTDLTFERMQLGDITVRDLRRRIVTFAGLQTGRNTIEIEVTAEDGMTTGTYVVTVARGDTP